VAHEKIEKSVALYMPAAVINRAGRASLARGKGAACGACMMAMPDLSKCAILDPADISLSQGVCGLFVGGRPMPSSQAHKPMRLVPRQVAGYYEGSGVPTHCSNCVNFEPTSHGEGTCKVVRGMVEEYGCCNSWEEKLDMPRPPFIHSP